MSQSVRYTAAKRREIAAARAAAQLAEDIRLAGLPIEDFLAEAAEVDLAATIDPQGFREFQTARHAELVGRFA